jgi:hypothetical protein
MSPSITLLQWTLSYRRNGLSPPITGEIGAGKSTAARVFTAR